MGSVARDVVERVVAMYGSARLYTDRARLAQTLAGAVVMTVESETSFARPHRFSTAARAVGLHTRGAYRIACEGEHIQFGDPEWRAGRPESLTSALETGWRLTMGQSPIPKLLLPDRVDGPSLFGAGDWELVGRDLVHHGEHTDVRVELERETNVITAVVWSTPSLDVETKTTFEAVLTV